MHAKNNKRLLFTVITIVITLIILVVSIFMYYKSESTATEQTNQTEVKSNNESQSSDAEDSNSENQDISSKKDMNRFEGLSMTNENVGIPVLYYHAVGIDHPGEELWVTPDQLKQQLQLVKDLGYTSLTMSEVNDYIKNNKPIPEKSILITFDDGYENNYQFAYPILKELELKATIFMVSSYIDKGFYLTSDQIKEMSQNGIDIESHTIDHVHLNELSYQEQLNQLKKSKSKIESITNKEIFSIAYPYGDYNEDTTKAAIEAGYSIAFTTNNGLADRNDNSVELNRIYVDSNDSIDIFKNKLINTKK